RRPPDPPIRIAHGYDDSPEDPVLIKSHPIVGGIVVSMSNPYWWVWWATVGFAFMAKYQISLHTWGALLAFFLGHEAGDLAWYLTVSTTVSLGRDYISSKVYGILLFACGIFVALFGLYLGVSPFLETA
ncbi:MAG TPA: LysE family transporter, partial [Spirochaetia bacterium]|nr:LysE family transporter [Spirochaetia bacterium]